MNDYKTVASFIFHTPQEPTFGAVGVRNTRAPDEAQTNRPSETCTLQGEPTPAWPILRNMVDSKVNQLSWSSSEAAPQSFRKASSATPCLQLTSLFGYGVGRKQQPANLQAANQEPRSRLVAVGPQSPGRLSHTNIRLIMLHLHLS